MRSALARALSSAKPVTEASLADTLRRGLAPTYLRVDDTSGGCGSFFAITVVSQAFAGKPLVAQHRMVQDLLKDEIKTLHGVTLRTHTPEQFAARVKADANAAD